MRVGIEVEHDNGSVYYFDSAKEGAQDTVATALDRAIERLWAFYEPEATE